MQLAVRSVEQNTAAVLARTWPKIHDVVGRAHHVGIVLHHHDRVAEIAKFAQYSDQPLRIPRVQADRGLVEHIGRAHQPRPETGRELNPLRFAARTASPTGDRA